VSYDKERVGVYDKERAEIFIVTFNRDTLVTDR